MYDIDTLVVGAGVIGLAIARELALSGREVVVVEAASHFGTETSSRNSEVVHAGIYYPPGSVKARLCVEGKERLYSYCAERGVAVRRLGKVIVATAPGQLEELDRLQATARQNGVDDLARLTLEEVCGLEPEVTAVGGLFSPSTGIVDSHAYMLALEGDIRAAGGSIAYRTPFLRSAPSGHRHVAELGGDEPISLSTREIINSAGLAATTVGRAIADPLGWDTPETYFARGNYFALAGQSPFRHLVYPVPEPGGLGVHATLDLGGHVRFGPDVEWIDQISYDVSPARADRFYDIIRRYWPGLRDGALQPAYSGVRPKLTRSGEPQADFLLRDRGSGIIDLMGIESPGLTSSLALADRVRIMLTA